MCTPGIFVGQNEITRVQMRYVSPNTADIQVLRTGYDLAVQTAPSNTYAEITSGTSFSRQETTNPGMFTLNLGNQYTVSAKNLTAYDVKVANCTYERGQRECVPTNIRAATCSISICNDGGTVDVNSPNRVYKYAFMYVPKGVADVVVVRTGDDQSIESVGATTSAQINGVTQTPNPATYTALPAGGSTLQSVFATKDMSKIMKVGWCSYFRGAPECSPVGHGCVGGVGGHAPVCDFELADCTVAGSFCKYDLPLQDANKIYKIEFKYLSDSLAAPTATSTGDVLTKVVGRDLTTLTAPAGVTTQFATQSMRSDKRYFVNNVPIGNYAYYAKYDANYSIQAGFCQYERGRPECSVQQSYYIGNGGTGYLAAIAPFNDANCDPTIGLCTPAQFPGEQAYQSVHQSVDSNVVTKIVWKYDVPKNADIEIKRVGGDLFMGSAPTTTAYYDTVAAVRTNPARFTNVRGAAHVVYSQYYPNTHVTSVGSCVYERGGTPCAVTDFNPAACDANLRVCKYVLSNVDEYKVNKVVFKYDELPANGFLLTNSGPVSMIPGNSDTTLITATKTGTQDAQTIVFGVTGLPSGATATFSPTTCNDTCTSTMTVQSTTATPIGTYPLQVSGFPSGNVTSLDMNVGNAIRIHAYSVVCPAESDLPNWGGEIGSHGTTNTPGRPITMNPTVLQEFLQSHPQCVLSPNWNFQWGHAGAPAKSGDFIGPAATGTGPTDWRNFDTPTAVGDQPAVAEIFSLWDGVKNSELLWVRENLKPGYITYPQPPYPVFTKYGAELFCHRDGYNYDDWDYVYNPQYGSTYYCVAFNAGNEGGPTTGDISLDRTDSAGAPVDAVTDSGGTSKTIYAGFGNTPGSVPTGPAPAHPLVLSNTPVGQKSFYVTQVDGVDEIVGLCTYAANTGGDCTPIFATSTGSQYYPTFTLSCGSTGSTWCTGQIPVLPGQTTKIVVKYVTASAPSAKTLSCSATPNVTAGKEVSWVASLQNVPANELGNYTYTWYGGAYTTANQVYSAGSEWNSGSAQTVNVFKKSYPATITTTSVQGATAYVTSSVSGEIIAPCTTKTTVIPRPTFIEI
jgi:hypothetical protein